MFCSNWAFSSSSGSSSKNIPKSWRFKFFISFNVWALYKDILSIKDWRVNGKLRTSANFKDIFSHILKDRYKLAWLMCLVAMLDWFAAILAKPTKASLSGKLPSLASLSPVTSLIICK